MLSINPTLESLSTEQLRSMGWLEKHIPYLLDPAGSDGSMIMLANGDLMAAFTVQGISPTSTPDELIETLAVAQASILVNAPINYAFYVHTLSLPAFLDPPEYTGDQPFVAEINQSWNNGLRNSHLRQRTMMVTILQRPDKLAGFFRNLFFRSNEDDAKERLTKRIEQLDGIVDHAMRALYEARPERLNVKTGHWLGHLASMITGRAGILKPSLSFTPFNRIISNVEVEFDNDVFLIQDADGDNDRVGTLFSYLGYPTSTYPGLMGSILLPYDHIITHSFTPVERSVASSRITRIQRQMSAADDAAISLQAQLREAADDLASNRTVFGDHYFSVVVFARNHEELGDAVSDIKSAVDSTGGRTVRETFGLRSGFFAQLPGNYPHRPRPSLISAINFAHLTALHGGEAGYPASMAPWGECIALLPTTRGEVYRFNFHKPGNVGERTLGHTLVLGQPGSGKTVGLAFLLTQAFHRNARIFVFDKDNGLEMAVRAMGGAYTDIHNGASTGLNPMATEVDASGIDWLAQWLTHILSGPKGELTETQQRGIYSCARQNAETADNLRTMQHFQGLISQINDDRQLLNRFKLWCDPDERGWLFSGTHADRLDLDSQVVGFDLTDLLESPELRTALLSYIFRQIERKVEDGKPTIIVIDEAWKYLDDPYFEKRLKDWLLTMRKLNVCVVLLTQFLSHITESAAGASILESIATYIIYPNPLASKEDFRALDMTEPELAAATTPIPGVRAAFIKQGQQSVTVNMDLNRIGDCLAVLGGGRGDWAPADWRDNPETLWRNI